MLAARCREESKDKLQTRKEYLQHTSLTRTRRRDFKELLVKEEKGTQHKRATELNRHSEKISHKCPYGYENVFGICACDGDAEKCVGRDQKGPQEQLKLGGLKIPGTGKEARNRVNAHGRWTRMWRNCPGESRWAGCTESWPCTVPQVTLGPPVVTQGPEPCYHKTRPGMVPVALLRMPHMEPPSCPRAGR